MRGTARRRGRSVVVVGTALVASVIGALPNAPAFAGPTPTYVDTIGGGTAGHADMYPSGVDVDGAGNLYVADTGDDQILSFGPAGGSRWAIGTRGPKAPGRFENPRDVAFHAGRVYVADTGYNRVQVLDASDGSVIDVWGHRFGTIMGISAGVNGAGTPVILVSESSSHSIRVHSLAGAFIDAIGTGPGSGAGQLNGVRDAATDEAGNVYAADYANSRFAVFRPSGAWVGAWGVNGTGAGQFKRPYGIDLDQSGDVYVADSNNFVHRFSPTGPIDPATFGFSFVRAYGRPGTGPGEFSMLRRVAVGDGASPSVYGADLWKFKIEVFGPLGGHLDTIGGGGPANGFFNEPYGVAVDGTHLFVVDMVNQRVQRFSASAPYGFQLAWGERGWGEGNPGLNWPKGIDILNVGGTRTVWVADTKNNRLQEFRPDGVPTGRKFGKPGAGIGQLKWPFAVASYGSRLVVADTNNNRVQLWDPAGPNVIWTSTGGGGQAFSRPKAVTVFGGRVYVADAQNDRVVVLDADNGAFISAFGNDPLSSADGVAVEPNGEIWVSDSTRQRLFEFSPSGTLLQTFGTTGSGNTGFNEPRHLAIQTTGSVSLLFVADSWNDRIQVYRVSG
jgi:DNA-binding beta-propeller fold protein YncE